MGRQNTGMNGHDMYGNEIYRLGETGYGISICFSRDGMNWEGIYGPVFTVFHASDGFRQSLFCVDITQRSSFIPAISNVFHERIMELMETAPHGRGDIASL